MLNAQQQGLQSLTESMAGMVDLEARRRVSERPITPPVSEWMPQRDEGAALGRFTERPAYQAGMQQFRETEQRIPLANVETRRALRPYLERGLGVEDAARAYLADQDYTRQPTETQAAVRDVLNTIIEGAPAGGISGAPLPGVAGKIPAIQPIPTDTPFHLAAASSITRPLLPESVTETLGQAPIIGPGVELAAEGVSTPLGLAATATWPAQIAAGIPGGIATRAVAEQAGVPEKYGWIPQVAGEVLTPGAGVVSSGLVTKPATAAGRGLLRGTAEEAFALGPRESALGKMRVAGKQAPEGWAENIRLSGEEFGKRSTRAAELRDKLISQGVPEQEAILRSTAELRGTMPFKAATGIDFTPAEEAWFWDVIIQGSQTGESIHVATYMQEMQAAIAAGRNIKDLPPHVWKVISKAHGEDFTNQLKEVVKQRARASEAALMAKAPEGVAPGPPVPTARGAEQAVFHPEFPAPGTTLSEVAIPERAGLLDFLSDTLGILKPLMSSADISWFRQIAKTIGRHPTLAWRSFTKGTKALVSERLAVETMDALKAEGTAAAGYRQVVRGTEGTREIGLGRLLENRYMAVPGTPGFAESSILRRPEFYMSRQAARVFGIRQSGRAFATGWNTNYQGMTRYWLPKLTKMNGGSLSQKQVDAALNLAERLTGVGKLGSDQSWVVKALKVLGFAPGYRVSGPEALVTLLSPTTDPLIRRMAFENLVTWATLGGSIMTAAKYGGGASVITTLGASQFGRIKFPGSDTYYNIWGTDGVLARAVLQAIVQRRVDVKGSITPLGGGEKSLKGFGEAFKDSFLLYLRSGETPAWGLLSDLTTGETYIGEKLHWDAESAWKVVRDRLPMFGQDMMDVFQTDGPIQTLLSFIPGATGTAGITSYEPVREMARSIPKYDSDDAGVVSDVLGKDVLALNLTANEERDLLRFLRDDVSDWVEELEDKHGPIPSKYSMLQIIKKVGEEKGLGSRELAGAVFLHKAKGNEKALNMDWIQFLLENRERLEDYYEETYDADYMQLAQQVAEERGLVPVR